MRALGLALRSCAAGDLPLDVDGGPRPGSVIGESGSGSDISNVVRYALGGSLLPARIVLLTTVPVMTVKCIYSCNVLLHLNYYIGLVLLQIYYR